jgi:hypothetical protein
VISGVPVWEWDAIARWAAETGRMPPAPLPLPDDLWTVSRAGLTGILHVQCLPTTARTLTLLAPLGTLAPRAVLVDRGVAMRVKGRAPWADARARRTAPQLATTHEAWTLVRVRGVTAPSALSPP